MKQRLLSLVTAQRVLCALALALSAGTAHAVAAWALGLAQSI